jgi:hypothetical protein
VPIFSPRSPQRIIQENDSFLSISQTKELVRRLSLGSDFHRMGGDFATSRRFEIKSSEIDLILDYLLKGINFSASWITVARMERGDKKLRR